MGKCCCERTRKKVKELVVVEKDVRRILKGNCLQKKAGEGPSTSPSPNSARLGRKLTGE